MFLIFFSQLNSQHSPSSSPNFFSLSHFLLPLLFSFSPFPLHLSSSPFTFLFPLLLLPLHISFSSPFMFPLPPTTTLPPLLCPQPLHPSSFSILNHHDPFPFLHPQPPWVPPSFSFSFLFSTHLVLQRFPWCHRASSKRGQGPSPLPWHHHSLHLFMFCFFFLFSLITTWSY